MKNSSLIHVARAGQTLGVFEMDKIEDMLESGNLLPGDFYYDDQQSAWLALEKWEQRPSPSLEMKTQRTDLSEEERRSGRHPRSKGRRPKSRSKKQDPARLTGWIACLFALAVAAGIWVWAQTLGDRVSILTTENDTLKDRIMSLQGINDQLSSLTPPNRIRGVVTYTQGTNPAALVTGVTVALYHREDVEKLLNARTSLPVSSQNFNTDIESLKSQLAAPVALTVTDSNGRVDIPAEPGKYVLVATASKPTKEGGRDRLVWLMGVSTDERPHSAVLLDEKNSLSPERGSLEINDVSALAGGKAN